MSKDQVKPGEQIKISVISKPNSFVGLLGVDQSVLLLKKGNDIDKSTVFNELSCYGLSDRLNWEWNEDDNHQNYRDFVYSEAAIITNAKDEYCKKNLMKSFEL